MEKINKIVFQQKNRMGYICQVIEHDDCYELQAQGRGGSWESAWFDKDKRVLDVVTAAIKRYGKPNYWSHGFVFVEQRHGFWKHQCMLTKVVYAAYHQLELDALAGASIRCLDENHCNLRCDNLTLFCVSSGTNTTQRRITLCGKDYILLESTNANGKSGFAVTNYSPELFQILSECRWRCHDEDRVPRVDFGGGEQYRLPLLVWSYFNCGLTATDWREQYEKIRQNYWKKDITIDHKQDSSAQCRKWDNRIENLQAIPRSLNSSKRNCTKNIPDGCFYIPTTEGAICSRIDTSAHTMDVYRMTNDPTMEEIQQLRHFCKTGELSEETNYATIDLSDAEAIEITLAAYAESKLYQEVYSLC